MHDIDWTSLTDAEGTAESLPELLEQLLGGSPDEQRDALDALYDRLLDDGFAFDATVAALPTIMAALPRLRRPTDRVAALSFLAEVAAGDGDTTRASLLPARRPAPWDDSVPAKCWLTLEQNLHHLEVALADKSVAVRAAAMGVMALVPPPAGELLRAGLGDSDPLVRGLAAIALARRAPVYKDGVGVAEIQRGRRRGDPVERALFAAALALLTATSASAGVLLSSLPDDATVVRHFPWSGGALRDWLLTVVASLPFQPFSSELVARLRGVATRRRSPWELSPILDLAARGLFAPLDADGGRQDWLPRTFDELTKPQREFLLLLSELAAPRAESWPYVEVSNHLVRCGLPVGRCELREASYVRSLRAFVGSERREAYFAPLTGRDGAEQPLFVWARRTSLGLVAVAEFAAALARLSPRQLVDAALVLGWAPRDLARTPGFDDVVRFSAVLSALRACRGTEHVVASRLAANTLPSPESFALVVFAIERQCLPPVSEPAFLARGLATQLSVTTREMVREALRACAPTARDAIIEALTFELAVEPDHAPTVSRWEVVDLASDRVSAARAAVVAARGMATRGEPAHEHRVGLALESLQPEAELVVREALTDGSSPWDDVLRRFLR